MPDSRLYSRTLAEKLMFLPAGIITVFPVWNIRYQYLSAANFFLSPVTPVSCQSPDSLSGNSFHLSEGVFNGVSVIFVPEGLGPQDNSGN